MPNDGTLKIGSNSFPDLNSPQCHEAAQQWRPRIVRRAIHSKVLVVAMTRIEGTWAAYVFPVAGRNHELEAKEWRTGMRVSEAVALALFDDTGLFRDLPYAG